MGCEHLREAKGVHWEMEKIVQAQLRKCQGPMANGEGGNEQPSGVTVNETKKRGSCCSQQSPGPSSMFFLETAGPGAISQAPSGA